MQPYTASNVGQKKKSHVPSYFGHVGWQTYKKGVQLYFLFSRPQLFIRMSFEHYIWVYSKDSASPHVTSTKYDVVHCSL